MAAHPLFLAVRLGVYGCADKVLCCICLWHVLRCVFRNVTDEALEELGRIPSLAHLTLKGSLATNAGLAHLRALPRLTHLDLGSRWELDDTGACGASMVARWCVAFWKCEWGQMCQLLFVLSLCLAGTRDRQQEFCYVYVKLLTARASMTGLAGQQTW
jgi:hypothetical protein